MCFRALTRCSPLWRRCAETARAALGRWVRRQGCAGAPRQSASRERGRTGSSTRRRRHTPGSHRAPAPARGLFNTPHPPANPSFWGSQKMTSAARGRFLSWSRSSRGQAGGRGKVAACLEDAERGSAVAARGERKDRGGGHVPEELLVRSADHEAVGHDQEVRVVCKERAEVQPHLPWGLA